MLKTTTQLSQRSEWGTLEIPAKASAPEADRFFHKMACPPSPSATPNELVGRRARGGMRPFIAVPRRYVGLSEGTAGRRGGQ